MDLPPDFGGVVGGWAKDGSRAFLLRFGHGKLQSAMRLTPVNLLAALQTLNTLLREGEEAGYITAEDVRKMAHFATMPLGDSPPREKVDDILGPD